MTETVKHIPKTRLESRVLFFAFVLLTITGFLGLDVLTPFCLGSIWGTFLIIVVVAQLTLICVWGTLVEGTFLIRLPMTILLLVISWIAFCLGTYVARGNLSSAEVLGIGLVWNIGFAFSYVPLQIAAWQFGWRIRLDRKNQSEHQTGSYAIRDIMLSTAIVAVILVIGRQLIPNEWPLWSEVLRVSGLNYGLFVLFIFSMISLIVKLPCIWIALATPRSEVFSLSLIWIFCSAGLGVFEMFLLGINKYGGPGTFEIFACLTLGHAAMATVMILVLFGLRCFGYRISRKRKIYQHLRSNSAANSKFNSTRF